MTQVSVGSLIEDLTLYPRHNVDDSHVRNLAAAIESGEDVQRQSRIMVDGQLRILDGFHRVRAFGRVYGEEHVIDVEQTDETDLGRLRALAISANVTHGKKLDERDKTRSILMLREAGVEESLIPCILHTTEAQVIKLAYRVVEVDGHDEPAPRVLWPRRGEPPRSVSQAQYEVASSVAAHPILQQTRSLARLLEYGIPDTSDERLVEELARLQKAITRWLQKKAA